METQMMVMDAHPLALRRAPTLALTLRISNPLALSTLCVVMGLLSAEWKPVTMGILTIMTDVTPHVQLRKALSVHPQMVLSRPAVPSLETTSV